MAKLLLTEMLKKRKMSKYRLAKILNADYKNTHRWFKPDYDPKLSTLAAWAKALKCKVRDLIKE